MYFPFGDRDCPSTAAGVGVGCWADEIVGGMAVAGAAGTGVELGAGVTVAAGGFTFPCPGLFLVAVSVGTDVSVEVGVTVGADVFSGRVAGNMVLVGAALSPEVEGSAGAT